MKLSGFTAIMVLALGTNTAAAATSFWDIARESYNERMDVTVYRDPNCGCCSAWIDHLEKHKFNVTDIKTRNMMPIKRKLKVPGKLASCHTATINGYVIEGHVPADDIKRLLKQKPEIIGLSVPQMPVGTPGMEQGQRKPPFAVVKIDDKEQVESFREYRNY
jgi:hypothetical protein